MPSQLKRYQKDGACHFVTFSCYRRRPYLNEDSARIVFEKQLERLRKGHELFGYVLKQEHVHLLLSEPKRHSLATTINVLKTEVSKQLKGERKQFWQRRYCDFNVPIHRKDVEKLRYMHRNPRETRPCAGSVRMGLVELQSLLDGRGGKSGD